MGFSSQRQEQELQEWLDEGIISASQAERIEARRGRGAGGPGAFAVLASIGGVCVALGVILVIAYNWDRFHRGWKLGGFLITLALIAEAAGRLPDRMVMVRSAVRMTWLVLPLAGIGLMAQVYQLSGDPLKPILLALVLGAPLVGFANQPSLTWLHTAGLAAAAWVGAHNHGTWLSLKPGWGEPESGTIRSLGIPLAGIALLWLAAGWQATRRLGPRSRRLLLAGLLLFLWSLATESTVFRVRTIDAQFMVVGALIALFQGSRGLLSLDDEGTDGWAAVITFGAIFAMTFLWHASDRTLGGDLETIGLAYTGALAIAGMALVLLRRPEVAGESAYRSLPARLLTLSPLVLAGVLTAGLPNQIVAVAANVAALGFAIHQMSAGVTQARPGRVTLGILMLGTIVVTRFLDYFGTMLQSGMAFIVTGLAFIGLAWALNRGRSALLERMRVTR